MDYFFSPLACSLAGHVLIREQALPIRTVPVSLQRKTTAEGLDFHAIAPKGQVPVLRFNEGRVLTENSAILQVLADLAPAAGLLPPRETPAGQATLEGLSFVSTELHKLCLYPLFQREVPDTVKAWCQALLPRKLAIVATQLAQQPWLAGERFTIADAYLGWALMLSQHAGVKLSDDPALHALQDYWQRLLARPAFAATLAEEQALFKQYA